MYNVFHCSDCSGGARACHSCLLKRVYKWSVFVISSIWLPFQQTCYVYAVLIHKRDTRTYSHSINTRTVVITQMEPVGELRARWGSCFWSPLYTHTHAHTANTTNNACNCFVFTWSAVHRLPSSPNFPLISLHLWLWITDCEDYYEWMLGGYGMAMACVNVCVMSLQRQPCSIRGVWFISGKRQFSDSPGISRQVDPLSMHRHTHKGKRRLEMTAEGEKCAWEWEIWTKRGWESGSRKRGRRKCEDEGNRRRGETQIM